MLDKLADGSWLTRERLRAVAILSLAATLLILAYLYASGSGTLDRFGRPLGTDFSNIWTAGRMALDGQAAEAWDWTKHYRVQQAEHGSVEVPFYGWHYPPPFLLLAAGLGFLPYLLALLIWQAFSLGAVALLVRRIIPHPDTVLLTLGAPVVFICLTHGHNGFLTAALLGGGMLFLDKRPFLAGMLLGCLIYKPQFALLIPPLLLMTGNWRAIAGASATALALIGATLFLWGWPVWSAFVDSLELTRTVVIESGSTGWHKIQSPFALARMWGGEVGTAYALQAFASLLAIGSALWLARAEPYLRNAAVMAAALISTPYVLDYDFVPLGLGVAFLIADGARRGFLSYEKSLLALIWVAPLFARQLAEVALLPLGLASAVTMLALAARRAVTLDGAAAPLVRSWPFHRSRGASAQ